VFLLEPNRTPYDLNFHVGEIHVRVHPLFWLMALIIGGLGSGVMGIDVLLGVGIVFVSILIHELGHAFTIRYYGEEARVVLYLMGGFATTQGSSIWELNSFRRQARSPWTQIVISAAVPAAGFLLAAGIVAIVCAVGGRPSSTFFRELIYSNGEPFDFVGPRPNPSAMFAVRLLLFVNIFWGFINLAPVYPLDGGQIARQVCILRDPYQGMTQSLWISVIAGAGLAIFGFYSGSIMLGVLFASFAYSSYQELQQYGGRGW
jgi:Zn-dependent protease